MTHPGADSAGGTRTDPVTGRAARVRQGLSIMLVVALTALTVVTLPLIATTSPAYRDPGALAYVLVGLAAAVTLLRHRWPVTACLATTAVVAAYLVLALPYGPIFGFIVLTVYALARHRPLRVSAPTAGVCLLLELAHVPISDASLSGGIAVLPALAWISIPFTIGASLRAVATARMRERSAADQRLVDTERLHVSQEVHDVVGHGLAAIQMQADITLHVHAGDPERRGRPHSDAGPGPRTGASRAHRSCWRPRGAERRGRGAPPASGGGRGRLSRAARVADQRGQTLHPSQRHGADPPQHRCGDAAGHQSGPGG